MKKEKTPEQIQKSEDTRKIIKDAGALLLACLYVPVVLIGVARKIKSRKF